MRAVVQRSGPARCVVDNVTTGEISSGLVVFLSIDPDDTEHDVQWMGNKISGLRIFPDSEGKMNLSLLHLISEHESGLKDNSDSVPGILSISQFTLHGRVRKGFRPSFVDAAPPEKAEEYYRLFNIDLRARGINVSEGVFGATMDILLVNEGPVTILIDSKKKF